MQEKICKLLDQIGIEYENISHRPISSVKNIGRVFDGEQVKNLVVQSKKSKNIYFVILKDEKRINFANLGEILEEKRLSFVKDEILENYLHSAPGTITPFGLIFDKNHDIKVVIDTDINQNSIVGFHPFINTMTTLFSFESLMKFLNYTGHEAIFINTGD